MTRLSALFLLVAGALGLSACSKSGTPEDPAQMSLTFEFQERHLCSQLSPQLDLRATPAETIRYRITLREIPAEAPLESEGQIIGADTIRFEGERVPEGRVLRGRWQGPCPPQRGFARYRMRVEALNADGQVIGAAEAERDL